MLHTHTVLFFQNLDSALPFTTFNINESLTALSKILTEHKGSEAAAAVQLFPSLVTIAVAAIAAILAAALVRGAVTCEPPLPPCRRAHRRTDCVAQLSPRPLWTAVLLWVWGSDKLSRGN
jgi:hypothetical protein